MVDFYDVKRFKGKQALEILEANGSSIENIIKCTCMLAAIEEWAEMNVENI
ncbi:MAG: hypothetical protein WBM83_00145 [Flavobacteriaceae bacterium]